MGKAFDNIIEAIDFKAAREFCDEAGKDPTLCMAKYDDVQQIDKDLYCGMSPFKLKAGLTRLEIEKTSAIKAIGRAIEKMPGMSSVEKKITATFKRGEESKRAAATKIEARKSEKIESCTALPVGNRADKRIS
jgi:hypothetical protein